jgi:hypothetical protein
MSPAEGGAQVALATVARRVVKQATTFVPREPSTDAAGTRWVDLRRPYPLAFLYYR